MTVERDEGRPQRSTAPPRRQRRSPEEIRRLLFAAARAEVAENGYAGATTANIARRAAVTEAQLFRYFTSKVNLFREAVFEPMSEHLARFADDALGANDAMETDLDRSYLYIKELREFLKEHRRLLLAMMFAQAYGSPLQNGMESLANYFDRGARRMVKGLGRDASIDPQLTVRVSFAAVLACVLFEDWLFPHDLADATQVQEAIDAFVLHGIVPVTSAKTDDQLSI